MPDLTATSAENRKASDPLPYPLLFASNYRRNFIGFWGHNPQTVRRDANKCSAPNNIPYGVFPNSIWPKTSLYQASFEAAIQAARAPAPQPKTHAELCFSSITSDENGEKPKENTTESSRVRRQCLSKSAPPNVKICDTYESAFDMPKLGLGVPYTYSGVQALRRLAEIHKRKATSQTSQPASASARSAFEPEIETIALAPEPVKAVAPAAPRPEPIPASSSQVEIDWDSPEYHGIRNAWIHQTSNHHRRRRPALQQSQKLINMQLHMRRCNQL